MKSLKGKANSIIVCVFELLVGILLFVDPLGFAVGIINGAGVVLLVLGVFQIIKYFRTEALEAMRGQFLFKGLLCLLAGIFCIFRAGWFIATFSVLTILYALGILAAGLGKIQWTADMLRLKRKEWYFTAVSAVLSIVCAVIIITNPFKSTAVLWQFTAIVLILEAVFDIIVLLWNRTEGNAA